MATEYRLLDALAFAQKWKLDAFATFVQHKFDSFSKTHYSGSSPYRAAQNPCLANLVFAHDMLQKDSAPRDFLLDQFAHSMLYRQAYSDDELELLTCRHPKIAASVMKRVQIIARNEHPLLHLATSFHDDIESCAKPEHLHVVECSGSFLASEGEATPTTDDFDLCRENTGCESGSNTIQLG